MTAFVIGFLVGFAAVKAIRFVLARYRKREVA